MSATKPKIAVKRPTKKSSAFTSKLAIRYVSQPVKILSTYQSRK